MRAVHGVRASRGIPHPIELLEDRRLLTVSAIVAYDMDQTPVAGVDAIVDTTGNTTAQLGSRRGLATDANFRPSVVPGRFGNAWNFFGPGATNAGTFLVVPSNLQTRSMGDLTRTTGLTVGLWAKYTYNAADGTTYLLGLNDNSTVVSVYTGVSGTNGLLTGNILGSTLSSPTTTNILDGNWHHFVISADFTLTASNVFLYVDGAQVATGSKAFTSYTTVNDLYIGANSVSNGGWAAGNTFPGSLDQVVVFDRAVSQAEVTTLYTSGNTSFVNQAPVVVAGADQTVSITQGAKLNAIVYDASGTPSLSWTGSGPGTVSFTYPNPADRRQATASFSRTGTYTLTLTAVDGSLTSSDSITVMVNPAVAPVVRAWSDMEAVVLPSVSLGIHGSVVADVPANVTTTWSVVSGPGVGGSGGATFASASALDTTVTFTGGIGTYVLRLTANDGVYSSSSDITVRLYSANTGGNNIIVNSGSSMQAWMFNPVVPLSGSFFNPASLSSALPTWSLVSGPSGGAVTFSSPNSLSTMATFSAAGVYTLSLGVSDGTRSGSSSVVVQVFPNGRNFAYTPKELTNNYQFPLAQAYDYEGFNFSAVSQAPAAAYQHPRIMFNASDLPAMRTRLTTTTAGQVAMAADRSYLSNTLTGAGAPYRAAYDDLAAGSLMVFSSSAFTGSQVPMVAALSYEAYRCLIDNDTAGGQKVAAALATLSGKIYSDLVAGKTSGRDQYNWQNISEAPMYREYFALGYDLAYNYMTVAQQNICRSAIQLGVNQMWNIGMDALPAWQANVSNWIPMINKQVAMSAMAVEGEAGSDPDVYPRVVASLQRFLNIGVFKDGILYEGMGKGALYSETLVALARRGVMYIASDASKNYITQMHLANMEPAGNGFTWDEIIGGSGLPGKGFDEAAAKLFYPNDPAVDLVYRVASQSNYDRLTQFTSHPVMTIFNLYWTMYPSDSSSLSAGQTYDQAVQALNGVYPNTWFSNPRGLLVTRDRWAADGQRLWFQPRSEPGGHSEANRGQFVYNALGRVWAPYIADEDSKYASVLRVDNIGPSIIESKVLSMSDTPQATFAAADLTQSYAWQDGGTTPRTTTPGSAMLSPKEYNWPWLSQPWNSQPDWYTSKRTAGDFWQPNTAMQYAYRTAGLVRSTGSSGGASGGGYTLITDDMKKDAGVHAYTWRMIIPDDVTVQMNGNDVILSDANRSLLVRLLDVNGTPSFAVNNLDGSVRSLDITASAVVGNFKVMLYPFWNGAAVPSTTWSGNVLTVVTPDRQTDKITYTLGADGRTSVTTQRLDPSASVSLPTVSLLASDPGASEGTLKPGQFMVTRTGSTASSLVVRYSVGGTALPGSDYAALGGSVTIPAGQSSATFSVTPVNNGVLASGRTVVATLAPDAGYLTSTALRTGSVTIADAATGSSANLSLTGLNIGTTGGSATLTNGVFTVVGRGTDITSTSDQFFYNYQSQTGDSVLTTRVSATTASKAGLMLRGSTAANSANAFVYVQNGSGTVGFSYRNADGGTTSTSTVGSIAAPVWLRLAVAGTAFTAFYSTDGLNWIQIGSTQTLSFTPTLAGLAATSTTTNTTFDNTSFRVLSSFSPASYTSADVGSAPVPGTTAYSGSTFTLTTTGNLASAGSSNSSPTLVSERLAYWPLSADGTIIARVTGITATGTGTTAAQAGLILRDSLDSQANYVAVVDPITASSGASLIYSRGMGNPPATSSITSASIPAVSITSITSSGTLATVTTPAPHNLTTGDSVTISGSTTYYSGTNSYYNGSFVVTVTSPTTFTYTMAGAPAASPSTGTLSYVLTSALWLKLVRTGSNITGFASYSGASNSWTQVSSVSNSRLAGPALVGMTVRSNNAGVTTTASFDNVSVLGGPSSAATNSFVSVLAPYASALEINGAAGGFLVSRNSSLGDLLVNFALGGTATNGTDYVRLGTSVVIPDGQTSVLIPVTPIDNLTATGNRTVTLTLASGSYFTNSATASTTLTITDAGATSASKGLSPTLWYQMNQTPVTTANAIVDATGRTTATMTGGTLPTVTAGATSYSSNSWSFTKSASYINVTSNSFTQLLGDTERTTGISASFWINHAYDWSGVDNYSTVLKAANGNVLVTYFQDSTGTSYLSFTLGSLNWWTADNMLESPLVLDGKWHHVAFSADFTTGTNNVNTFIDGRPVQVRYNYQPNYGISFPFNTPFNAAGTSANVQIGGMTGQLDDVAFFTRALTTTEVQTLFSKSPAPYATFTPVASPVTAGLSSATLVFDRPVSGLTLSSLSLSRDGTPITLTSAQTPTNTAGGVTWTIPNLASLTSAAGNYALKLTASGSGVKDSSNALIVQDAQLQWLNWQTPTGLSASAQSFSSVRLGWTNASSGSNPPSLQVQRSPDGVSNWTAIATLAGTATTYTDTAVADGTTYSYRLLGVSSTGTTAYTSSASVLTPLAAVSRPAALQVPNQVLTTVTWGNVSSTATSIRIDRSSNAGATWTTLATSLPPFFPSYTDTNVAVGQTYLYRITASSAQATAPAAQTSSITVLAPVAPTIVNGPAASPNPATSATTTLSVLASDPGGEALLTYNWTVTAPPNVPPITFPDANSNSAKNVTVSFLYSGTYVFTVTVTNPAGLTVTDSVSVVVPNVIPVVPANLRATENLLAQVVLNWNADPLPGTTYAIRRSLSASGPFTPLVTGLTTNTYTDAVVTGFSVPSGTPYYYIVTATNNAISGPDSPVVSVPVYYQLLNRATGGAAASFNNNSGSPAKAFDGLAGNNFKWWSNSGVFTTGWISYDFGAGKSWPVTRYDIVSGNDHPERDPASWNLQGSNDNANWTTLDARTGQVFTARDATNSYSFTNTASYRYYRLFINSIYNSPVTNSGTQLDELALYAAANTAPVVVTPASVSGSLVTGSAVNLSVLGNDNLGESAIRYTWAATGSSPASLSFTPNTTNASKNTSTTLTLPGTYTLQATLTNTLGLSVASNLSFTVVQAPPASLTLSASSDTGVQGDNLTNRNNTSPDRTLTFNVTGTVTGTTVRLYAGNTLIGSAPAASSGSVTAVTTDGVTAIPDGVSAITAALVSANGIESARTPVLNLSIDTVAPTVSVAGVPSSPTSTSVPSLTLSFSEAIQGLTLSNLSLTRDSETNALTAAQTPTSTNQATWSVPNLTSLTTRPGSYAFSLTAAGITDVAGNALASGAQSAWLRNTLTATSASNALSFALTSPTQATVTDPSGTYSLSLAPLPNLTLDSAGGNDTLTLTGPAPAIPLRLTGNFTLASAPVLPQLTVTGTGTAVSALSLNATSVSLESGAALNLTGSAAAASVVSSLSIASAASLDVGTSVLILRNASSTLSSLQTHFAAGRLKTTANSLPYTTLALFPNDAGSGIPAFTAYNGVPSLTPSDVIVKYTYTGDTNLDGILDGQDYRAVNEGFLIGLSGWANGDVDNSGNAVSSTDLNTFNTAYNYYQSNSQPNLGSGAAFLDPATATSSASTVPVTSTASTPTYRLVLLSPAPRTVRAQGPLGKLTLAMLDADGRPVTALGGKVQVSAVSAAGTVSLSGTTTVSLVRGKATFSNLRISTPGVYTLRFTTIATDSPVSPVVTPAFTVVPLPSSKPIFSSRRVSVLDS